MRKMLQNTLVGLSILLFAVYGMAATITIDGDMSDWTADMQVDVAPGDVEEAGDQAIVEIDIKDVYMTNDADFIYIRVDINEDGMFGDLAGVSGKPQIFLDTDMSATTGLTWDWWATGVDYWIEWPLTSQDTIVNIQGAGSVTEWVNVPCATFSAINADDNGYELAISRADLGLLDAAGVRLLVLNEETATWGNDAFPNDIGSTTMDYFFSYDITIDGDMTDWLPHMQMDAPPHGVEETGDIDYASMDIKDVYMTYNDEFVFIRVDINEDGIFGDLASVSGKPQIFLDTDASATTGLTWDWWATGVDYWIEWPLTSQDTITNIVGAGSVTEWVPIECATVSGINADDNAYELSIERDAIGEIGTFYESLRLLVLNEETVNWSNDAFPNDLGGETATFAYGSGGTARVEPVAIDEELISIPSEFAIVGNYPNPFNPSTTIRFTLGDASAVSLEVYNMLGQKVASVYNGMGNSGANEITWNGMNDFNQSVDSGVYLYRISTPTGAVSGKMIMLK